VLNQEYATMIARDWNVKHSGSGYVARFHVRRDFLDKYDTHQVGGRTIIEYWITADLANLNAWLMLDLAELGSGGSPRPVASARVARYATLLPVLGSLLAGSRPGRYGPARVAHGAGQDACGYLAP
jgi:hypothetical protein